jgi:hypothetical protein
MAVPPKKIPEDLLDRPLPIPDDIPKDIQEHPPKVSSVATIVPPEVVGPIIPRERGHLVATHNEKTYFEAPIDIRGDCHSIEDDKRAAERHKHEIEVVRKILPKSLRNPKFLNEQRAAAEYFAGRAYEKEHQVVFHTSEEPYYTLIKKIQPTKHTS